MISYTDSEMGIDGFLRVLSRARHHPAGQNPLRARCRALLHFLHVMFSVVLVKSRESFIGSLLQRVRNTAGPFSVKNSFA